MRIAPKLLEATESSSSVRSG
uniref:Uncharacterized protein n=1 Tax=Anguilla anguilla TaxID=7936 RepID=A0A0E9U6G3_ANGAN